MTLKMPRPATQYSSDLQARSNQTLEAEDLRNRKKGTDIELGVGERLIVRSPNGTRFSISVSNTGVVTAAAAVP